MKLRLTFLTGHHQGQVLEFEPGTIVLGRSSQAGVQIYDERISRRHCAIKIEGDGARVKDMGSGNGTYVNDAEIRQTVLANGDTLRVGRTEITVSFLKEQELAPDLPPTMSAGRHANLLETGGPGRGALPNPMAATTTGKPVDCAFCGNSIPAADVPLAVQSRGKFLCQSCAPRIEVPGFKLERSLGEGAMGVVYLARDERTNAPVALKVLKTRGDLSPEDRARFVREVSTSAQLHHPNIVRVLGHGEAPPYLYYLMEYVPGLSLNEWIKKHGALPLPSVLRVSVQVADALEHARQRNIVHRDVKPENIIVMGDGTAKLADFGLAKNILTSGASGLTRPGDGLGTLPYMPPEQIEEALYADHRSDIYSFGATMFHMLTARPPFNAKTPLEFFTRIRSEPPPPISSVRRDVPQVLITMVEKSMAKTPEGRYQTIGDMIGIMQQFLRSEFDSRQTAS